jgi:hypothetical protein
MEDMAVALKSRTVHSSALSRQSADVFRAADEGPVTITRRGGESLILERASEVERQRNGMRVASEIVAASLSPLEKSLVDRLRGPYPWLEFLSPADRDEFAAEAVDVARACAAVGRFDRLVVTVDAWRHSAEAIAAGYIHDDELEWLDESEPVTNPRRS